MALGFGVTETPITNRGLKFQTDRFVGIDFFCGTSQVETLEILHKIVGEVATKFLDQFVWEPEKGVQCGRYYKSRASSVHGLQLAYSQDESCVTFRLQVPATAIKRIGQQRFFDVCKYLASVCKFKCTRIDIALDDYTKELPFELVEEWLELGCAVGYKHGWEVHRNGKRGKTVKIGSRQSDKMVRYYDKSIESKGELDCYRWEAEFHNSKSDVIFNLLVSQDWDELQLIKDLVDIALSAVDFRDRSVNDNVSRCPEVAAWQCFKEVWEAEHIGIPCPKVQSSVEKKMNWMQKQVATSLNILSECLGDVGFETFLNNLVVNGKRRMKSCHDAIINLYDKGWDDSKHLAEIVWRPLAEC